MITLIAGLLRLTLLVVFTFGFMVLFQHGPANYVANAEKELFGLQNWNGSYKAQAASPAKPAESATPPPAEVEVALPEN